MPEPTRMTEAPAVHDHAPGREVEEELTVPELAGVPEVDDAERPDAGVEHRASADDLDELFGPDR